MSEIAPGYYWARKKSGSAWVFGEWCPIRVAVSTRGTLAGRLVIYTCGAAPNYSTVLDDWVIGARLEPPATPTAQAEVT